MLPNTAECALSRCFCAPKLAQIVACNEAAEIHHAEALDTLTDAIEAAGFAKAEMPHSGTPQADPAVLWSAMQAIPNPGNEVHYDHWIRLGYACYRGFGGDAG